MGLVVENPKKLEVINNNKRWMKSVINDNEKWMKKC
jgi:hypothetical protein